MKGQSELMGLAIIVVIIVSAVSLFAFISISQKQQSGPATFFESNLAAATLDALFDSTITCGGSDTVYKLEGLMESCSSAELCSCRNMAIGSRLAFTFGEEGVNKAYQLTWPGNAIPAVFVCETLSETATHLIPAADEDIEVTLQVC